MISNAVTPDGMGSGMGERTPWQSMLAWGLSLVTHAGLFILVAVLLTPSPYQASRARRVPPQFVLAQTSLFKPTEGSPYSSAGNLIAGTANSSDATLSLPASLPSVQAFTSLIPADLALPTVASVNASDTGLATGYRFTGGMRAPTVVPGGIDVAAVVSEDRLRIAARQPVGEPTGVSLYGGSVAEGRSFIFLIDRSKSTASQGSGLLMAAENELLSALKNLRPIHRFQVIAYHDQCQYLHRREMLWATDENKNAVAGFIRGLVPVGATEHEMALNSALRHEPDVVYLLTDGGDPYLSAVQIQRITKLAGGRTAIHCVGFGYGPAPESHDFLRQLAEQNRGGYCYVDLSRHK